MAQGDDRSRGALTPPAPCAWTVAPCAGPAVVRIIGVRGDEQFVGTGWAIADAHGRVLVATARHVVAGLTLDQITVFTAAGYAYHARTIVVMDGVDVALVQLDGPSLPTLAACASPPRVGALVTAFGYPAGAAGTARTASGVVLPHATALDDAGAVYLDHSARIRPGYSGGPLVAAHGACVAGMDVAVDVLSAGRGERSVSLALPITDVRDTLSILRAQLDSTPM